jgi:peptidyl-prolyl cis-trans isomerase SurA
MNHLFAIATSVFLIAISTAAQAAFVDEILAVVNNEVITVSELNQTVALNERLGSQVRDEKTLRAETLNGLITRRLLVQEARRLKFVEITEQEIDAETGRMQKRLGSAEALAGLLNAVGLTRKELDRMLGEQVLVRKFIEKKFGLFVRITRDDAQQYYDAHPGEFRGKSFLEAQKGIMARLADERIDTLLDQYVAELRTKADIRINRVSEEPVG